MMKAFVFSTNKDKLTQPPISISEDIFNGFGNNDNNILVFEKSKESKTIDTTVTFSNSNLSPYFILISDTVQFPYASNGNEMGISSIVKTLLKNYDEIYLVIHKTNPSNFLKTFKRLFGNKLKSWVYENHNQNSVYDNILKRGLTDTDINDLTKMEEEILQNFPNPYLKSLIRLHKSLDLIPLKKEDFNERLSKLKIEKEYKLAFELFDDEKGKNGKDAVPTFEELLDWTAQKILELSKTP